MSHLPRPPPTTASHFLATAFPLRKLDRMPSMIKDPLRVRRKLNARRIPEKRKRSFLSILFLFRLQNNIEIDILIVTLHVMFLRIEDYWQLRSLTLNIKYNAGHNVRYTVIKDKHQHSSLSIVAQSTREEGKVCISICGDNEFPRVIIQPSKRREIFWQCSNLSQITPSNRNISRGIVK